MPNPSALPGSRLRARLVTMTSRRSSRVRPLETWSVAILTAAFAVAFAVERLLGLGWSETLALRPDEFFASWQTLRDAPSDASAWVGLAHLWTPVFAHADAKHLLHNAIFFWLFGSLLVRVAGNRWLLATFALTAATASLAYALRNPDGLPMLGASGAISGVAGAYCLLAFRWDVPDAYAWPLAYPISPLHAAAAALLAAGADALVLADAGGAATGIAHEAHLGGFVGGLFMAMLLTTLFPSRDAFLRFQVRGHDIGARRIRGGRNGQP
jgi:membrane associated rhomboid family serine protease